MRIAQSIFVGSVAVLAALLPILASPASANSSSLNSHANANAKVEEEPPASPGCRAYQKGPDGSWVELACHEGSGSAPPPEHSKSASHTSGETTR